MAHKKIKLMDLTERTCRWPVGHPGEPSFHFCGAITRYGVPYCAHHTSMAYAPLPRRVKGVQPVQSVPILPAEPRELVAA